MTSPTSPRATPSGLTRTSVRSVTTVFLLGLMRANGDRAYPDLSPFCLQGLGPQRGTGGVTEVDGQRAASAVDVQLAEVLESVRGRGVRDRWRVHENGL